MRYTKQPLLIALLAISSFYSNAQNVGIGTTTPAYKLTVNPGTNNWGIVHTDGNVTLGSYIYSTGIGEFGTRTNHPFYLFANNLDNPPAIAIDKGGIDVGIGNLTPIYTLDIHSGGNAQFNLKEGVGGQTALFSRYSNRLEIQPSDAFEISVSGVDQRNLYVSPFAVGVGMVPTSTTQRLQLLLPVNGTGIYMSGTSARIALDAQSGDLYIENGNIGIGTTSPIAPLDIESLSSDPSGSLDGYAELFNEAGNVKTLVSPTITDGNGASIYSGGDIVTSGVFAAASDARIKDIDGITNNEKDLAILNAIQVTNYTMKDKIKSGDKPFKKVIAQQVEKVYPQVVNKGVNYIPNVYQLTSKIEKTPNGYLLTFNNKHNIDKDAKKLQLIGKNGKKQLHDIVAIPSDYQVLIHSQEITDDTVFVYGEQVNDFRTVDYDGLTTLNISATQELSKLLTQQQTEIDEQNKKITELEEIVKKLEAKN